MAERGNIGGAGGAGGGGMDRARRSTDFDPLVTTLGGGNIDFSSILAIADILPVMVAYIDRDLIYRFVNKPLADWIGRPRKEILGRHMRDVIGDEAIAERKDILDQALKGERMF